MQKKFFLLAFILNWGLVYSAEFVCTISTAGFTADSNGFYTIPWNSSTPPLCTDSSVSINGISEVNKATIIIVPPNVNLVFTPNNTPAWQGTLMVVQGKLTVSEVKGNNSFVVINSSITIMNGGVVMINSKLMIGNTLNCDYILEIQSGGSLVIEGGDSDRLNFCSNSNIVVAGDRTPPPCIPCEQQPDGSFNCPKLPSSSDEYCIPPDGIFLGPISFNKDGALPIELLFLRGKTTRNSISLFWATASELNFHYFDIQKSQDGILFNSIDKVNGHGTTNERKDYSFEDEKPYTGRNYYRLKAVDLDGYSEVFDVIMVEYDGEKNFSVFPNPSEGYHVETETNFVPLQSAYISIYSSTGSQMARFKVDGDRSTLTMPVKLEAGWYYAKFISSDFTSVSRFLVR